MIFLSLGLQIVNYGVDFPDFVRVYFDCLELICFDQYQLLLVFLFLLKFLPDLITESIQALFFTVGRNVDEAQLIQKLVESIFNARIKYLLRIDIAHKHLQRHCLAQFLFD